MPAKEVEVHIASVMKIKKTGVVLDAFIFISALMS